MAPSPRMYVLEGIKLSVDTLERISRGLPPPTSTVVSLVQQVIAIAEAIHDNQEQCQLLIDRLLRLLLVILAALKRQSTGIPGQREMPPDVKWRIDRFKDNLGRILKDVTKIQSIVNSHRKRDKLRAALLTGLYKADIKKCCDQLDWAMKEFDVSSRLTDAIRLCTVSRQVHQVLTNQHLDKLPIAKYARFDCERPDHPSSCFQGTREAIIKEIIAWITNPDAQRFFWLSGLAGIGKTTLARTVAELAQSFGLLGANFFFSRRGEAELRNPALVFPTIAHQLALFDPTFCEPITAAIQAHPEAPFASLKQQLDHLIIEPLSGLERDPERVVILIFDAFDECEPVGAATILQLLVAATPTLPFFLKIFVTSRPEPHIRTVLVPSTDQLRITALHDIEASVVKGDILVYLRASIRNIPQKKGLVMPLDWVTDEEIELIAEAAGKLFIYAATARRALEEAYSPREQLDALLELATRKRSAQDDSNPFAYLDELYLEVLLNPITPTNKAQAFRLLQVLLGSMVLLRNPLSVDALERLTGMRSGEALATLNTLHSVILPPSPPDNCPRTYHPSFPDFLQDPARCTDPGLFIDSQKHETRMAICCLELLNAKLHQGMLGNLGPILLNSEVENVEQKVNIAIPPELQYACRFWASHLARVPYPEVEKLCALLASFASLRLLSWLESMSWMGRTREAVDCLELANSWVAKSCSSSITTNLLNDGYRLLLAHFPTITQAASRIALSVLPFVPRNTQLRSTYREYTNVKVILGDPGLEWSPCLMTWKLHSRRVFSVAISSNGTRIVSGCSHGTIEIHDASSGGFIMALIGHSGDVLSVVFCPDGSRVASGSQDRTVRLWDATTGHELLKLEGYMGTVFSVVFSPEGGHIASASSRERTIRVSNAVTGATSMNLEGHASTVCGVAFFPGGTQLVSGSDDRTVRIWQLVGGTCLAVLEGHSDEVYAVAVSQDGLRIASGSKDQSIRIWDVSSSTGLAILEGHTGWILSVAFSPTGSRIVSGSVDSTVRLWNGAGDNIATFQEHTRIVSSVVFSPDGRRVVSGSSDGNVKVWDANALTETASQDSAASLRYVSSFAFSSDGTRLASFDYDDGVQVQDLVEGCSVALFPTPPTPSFAGWSVHFSPDDTRIIVASKNHSPMIFDAINGNQIEEEELPAFDIRNPNQIPFEVKDGKLLRNDVSPPAVVCILPPPYNASATDISSFKLDRALGDRVAVGFHNGRVLVLDVAT